MSATKHLLKLFINFFRGKEGAEILGLQPYRPPHYDDDDDVNDSEGKIVVAQIKFILV